jgi:hypothetical protein
MELVPVIINATMAAVALSAVVEQYGEDYVYPTWDSGCTYERNGSPDCGVGKALAYLGVSVDTLTYMDCAFPTGINFVQIPDVHITTPARAIFATFQAAQDGGFTWGLALREALDVYAHP